MVYALGAHTLEVIARDDLWMAVLDGVAIDQWFTSLAGAWTAGVTEVIRLDAGTACSIVGGPDGAQQH